MNDPLVFQLTRPASDTDAERMKTLLRDLNTIAEQLNAMHQIPIAGGQKIRFMFVRGAMTNHPGESRTRMPSRLTEIQVGTLIRTTQDGDEYGPARTTHFYVFTPHGGASISYRHQNHATTHKLGSWRAGLAHLMEHLRDVHIIIRDETNNKIVALNDLISGLAPLNRAAPPRKAPRKKAPRRKAK